MFAITCDPHYDPSRRGNLSLRRRAVNFRRCVATKLLLAGFAFAWTAAAGTVAMHTVYAFDKDACASFREMIVAANVAHMNDDELCTFRFARLPAAKARGFASPRWTELQISDPVHTFEKISLGNNPPGKHYQGFPRPDILESVAGNSTANNLKFYRAQVQIDGEGPQVTLLSADIVACPRGKLNNEMGAPALFAFNDETLTEQEPMQPSSYIAGGAQVALWKGNVPVELSIFSSWIKIGDTPGKVLIIDLMGWVRRKRISTPEEFYAYPVCSISLNKKD